MRLVLLCVCLCLPIAAGAVSVIGKGAAVTVGDVATALDDPSVDDELYTRRLLVCVPATAPGPIYVGPASVTLGSGMPVEPENCFAILLSPKTKLYAIASAPVEVRVQEYY